MAVILRDIGALARARRRATTLEAEKVEAPPTDATATSDDNVSGALDAVRAVLPVTLLATYTSGVVALQAAAKLFGADDRAAEQAALAKQFGADAEGLKKALKDLTVDPDNWAVPRVGWAILMLVLIGIFAFYKANHVPAGQPALPSSAKLEPFVAIFAFLAWAFAAPGTFMAAFQNEEELAATTLSVALATGAILTLLGLTVLRARANRSVGWAPAVGPFDEFDGDHEGDGECDLVEAVVDEAVGVAA